MFDHYCMCIRTLSETSLLVFACEPAFDITGNSGQCLYTCTQTLYMPADHLQLYYSSTSSSLQREEWYSTENDADHSSGKPSSISSDFITSELTSLVPRLFIAKPGNEATRPCHGRPATAGPGPHYYIPYI